MTTRPDRSQTTRPSGPAARRLAAEYLRPNAAALGLAAVCMIAAAAGTAAAWGVVRFVMRADWVFLPGTLAVVVLACTALTLAFGYAGTALALRARPAPMLRNE